jgi:tetraacyldisaccharide 4'-kinase
MDRTRWRAIVSGDAHGLGPALARTGFCILAIVYGLATQIRDWSYRFGFSRQQTANLPVISVGNVTAGGTGKTPACAAIAQWFRERGVRVCFLSRGYGAVNGPNDEALVLEQLCPDVPHLQGPDRAALAQIAHAELDSQLVILDDGFQHRRLARDLDIVLIDATNPWGYGWLLPRGLLREPLSALRRAQLVLVTRVDQVEAQRLSEIRSTLQRVAPGVPVVESEFAPTCLRSASGATVPLDTLKGQRVAAFCGLGNPTAFQQTVRSCGAEIVAFREFPDHHPYARTDVDSLREWAQSTPASAVITSQKDLVKIGLETLGSTPLRAIQIDLRFRLDRKPLDELLEQVRQRVPVEATT